MSARLSPKVLARLEQSDERLMAHDPKDCAGRGPCSLHKRSDHPMRAFPQHWRGDIMLMERICPHGIGHPDPDCRGAQRFEGIHGCDGCCVTGGN